MCFCDLVPNVEWAGYLFYKVVAGDIDDPDNMVIHVHDLLPYSVDTSASFKFKSDDKYIKYIIEHDLLGYDTGLIHSHNNMPVFFSGTYDYRDGDEAHGDKGELMKASKLYKYFLSIVVNNSIDIVGKISSLESVEHIGKRNVTYVNKNGDKVTKEEDSHFGRKCVKIYDVDIVLECYPDDDFVERVEELKSKKASLQTDNRVKITNPDPYTFWKPSEINQINHPQEFPKQLSLDGPGWPSDEHKNDSIISINMNGKLISQDMSFTGDTISIIQEMEEELKIITEREAFDSYSCHFDEMSIIFGDMDDHLDDCLAFLENFKEVVPLLYTVFGNAVKDYKTQNK